MAIHLKWSNQNASGNSLKVYRREGREITPETKGTAIATIDSAAVEYTDNTAEPGVTYAYLLEVIAPLGSAYSRPTITANLRRVGPGGVEVLVGDTEFGYMGEVQSYELPDVWGLLNFSEGKTATAMRLLKWYKFVRKGRILYVPSIQTTTSYGDYDPWLSGIWVFNTSGIASGIEWNFPTTDAKYAPYKRQRIITNGVDRFHLRAPRAYPDDWNGVVNTSLTLRPDTEVNQIIQSMYQGCIIGNNVGSVTPMIVSQNQYFMRFICAESLVASSQAIMNMSSALDHNFAIVSEWNQGCQVLNSYNTTAVDRISYRFRNAGAPTMFPVLQLIEE